MSRQRDHAIATPVSLISRLAHATSLAEVRWAEAREKQDFAIFAPHLEEVLHLVRDSAALLGQALNLAPYDALHRRLHARPAHAPRSIPCSARCRGACRR